jgi:hypothetical protein
MRSTAVRERLVKPGILRVFHDNQGEAGIWRCLRGVNSQLVLHGSSRTLTVKPAQSSILPKAGWSNANPVVFDRAISTTIVDRNVDLRRACIQRVPE